MQVGLSQLSARACVLYVFVRYVCVVCVRVYVFVCYVYVV